MINTVTRYFRQGTPGVDTDTPEAPIQGVSVLVTRFDPAQGEFTSVQRDAEGKPALGYLATEISEEEARVWFARMQGAAQAPRDGYQDDEGVWFPGDIGAGYSVINEEGQAFRLARQEALIAARQERTKQAQSLTPRQAREALIRLGRDDEVEAAVNAIADPVERKIVRNWFEFTTEWVYGHPVLTQFAAALNFDKDEFFALAKTL